jgi:sugar phosphate isomerase/epimerase
MKWILNTYQTAQKWPLDRIISMCQQTGYDGIEFLQNFEQLHGAEEEASDAEILAIKAKMDAAGLITGSLTSCRNFHSPNEAELRDNIAKAKRTIDEAALIGCDHVRVLGDQIPDDEAGKERVLTNVAAALRELGTYAQPKGITVSIEAHSSFTDPVYVTRVVREANLRNVGIVFNSQWRVGAEKGWGLPPQARSILPLYDLIGPYITDVHTHRMEQPEIWPYYREFFQLLMRDGYDGYVSNECAYTGPDPETVLRFYTTLFHAFTS